VDVTAVTNLAVWGNHSPTMFPDFHNARIHGDAVTEIIHDHAWLEGEFLTTVQQRGSAIIKARGASSAASAANAVVDTVRSLTTPTREGEWHSVCVCSPGDYDVPAGLICSFPIRTTHDGGWEIAKWVPINPYSRGKIDASVAELSEERAMVAELL
jgi:malate dehydrogenase